MASIINAATSGGLVTTADTSGILQLQSNGTTALSTSGANLTAGGLLTFQATTLPTAGTASIFNRSSDSTMYLQAATGGGINLLDGSQNSMATLASTSVQLLTGNTARLTVSSDGRVTMPYQSGFAYGSSEVTVVGSNYILFSNGSYNYNVGSILNLTGGTSGASRVTVPVSGYYSVNVSIMGSTDGTRIEMFVTKNGTNIFGTNSISSQYNNAQINGVFYFAANDYLEIYKQSGSIYASSSPNNFFTVRLLG